MRTNGYAQIRRGLMAHLREGRITFMEYSLFSALLLEANPATGLVYGSAGLFATMYGLPPRTVRDALEKLEAKAYLKRWATQGKHGSYPLLINKFECTDGAMKGKRVNAVKTTSCEAIVFESCYEDGDDGVNEGAMTVPQVKRIENRKQRIEKETNTSVRSVPPEELAGTLPLVGDSDYQISKQQIRDWSEAFPGVDVKAELKQAKEWLKANPTRGKTRRGILRFAVNWLDKAQNSTRGNGDGKNHSTNGKPDRHEQSRAYIEELYGPAETADCGRSG